MKPQRCEYFFAHELRGRVEYVVGKTLDLAESHGALRSGPTKLDHRTLEDAGFVVHRVFDEHVTLSHPDAPTSRRAAERALFDELADEYDHRVDLRKNRAMISLLLDSVNGARVLDFGCGTGLSLSLALERNREIVGFDVSEQMAAIARSRGMTMVSLDELQITPARPFDAIIASYVLHLASAIDEFALAIRTVPPGGYVAANFHKGRGFVAVSGLLLDSGFGLSSTSERWGSTIGVWTRETRPIG